MSIWQVRHDSECYLPRFPTREEGWGIVINIHAGHMPETWRPITVEIAENGADEYEAEEAYEVRIQGDFFALPPGLPVVAEKSWEVLKQLVEDQVKLLEIDCREQKLWIMNPNMTVDCIDEDKSSFARLPSGEYLLTNFIVFQSGCVDDLHIFKIEQFKEAAVFVSDALKELIEVNKLKGLKFQKITG